MTDEEWKAHVQQWRQRGGVESQKAPDPATTSTTDDPSLLSEIGSGIYQTGRGMLKGAYSNIAGLETAASKATGIEALGPSKTGKDWLAQQDESGLETAGRFIGDYGSLAIPGLDFGLGARFGTKAAEWALDHGPEIATLAKTVGPARAQKMIEGLWGSLPKLGTGATRGAIGGATHDPNHPLRGVETGATIGTLGTLARQALPATWRTIPHALREAAKWATVGSTIGLSEEAMRNMTGRGGYFPGMWHLAYGFPSALAGLAGFATGKPAIMGAAASDINQATQPNE